MAEYLIEPYKAEHFHSLKRLFKTTFDVEMELETFQREYNTKSIGGEAISYVAVYQKTNEVVAHYAALPVRAAVGARALLAAQANAAMTDEKHRGKGLFKTLAEKVHDECRRRGIHFIFSQPNSESYHAFLKVFNFTYIDDIVRWDLKLKYKTAPLARLLIHSALKGLYTNYCLLVLKKYIIKKPLAFTNASVSTDIRIVRDQHYLAYKQSNNKVFLQIDGAVFWIKLTDIFWIGEVNDYEKVTLSVIRKLKRIAFVLGYNTISFHFNNALPKPVFLHDFQKYKTEPSTIFYFDEAIRDVNLILTGADYDTW